VSHLLYRLGCLGRHSEAWVLLEREDVIIVEHDTEVVAVEIAGEAAHLHVVALAHDDDVVTLAGQGRDGAVRDVHQRARRFDHGQSHVAGPREGPLGRAMGRHHQCLRPDVCDVLRDRDALRLEGVEHGGVVDEVAENREGAGVGVLQCERDGIANAETHAEMVRPEDAHLCAGKFTQRTLCCKVCGIGVGDLMSNDASSEQPVSVVPLMVAGAVLGIVGDALLRVGGPPGLNMSLWVAAIALSAYVLQRRAGVEIDRERVAWLVITVLFAAGLAWRDSTTLKPLALGCTTLGFALAAYRVAAAWVRRAGVSSYAWAWGTGALHAWTAALPVLVEGARSAPRPDTGSIRWSRAAAVARGLVIVTPLVLVFGALFMSADDVFADLVLNVVRIDVELIATHVFFFSMSAWLATGYLRGFLSGTELTPLRGLWLEDELPGLVPTRPTLGITEVATAVAALDLLFLLFVAVQFRYLFGGDTLVQVTPNLTYAEYARSGFFELVFAVVLVVPVLLAADWLLARRQQRDDVVFRALAGVQIALVLAITASALFRLRLYHASYGLTESRFYAMVLLIWIGAMLLWLAATVLRGRRDSFAFGALASGLATIALLFVINPDAVVARTNVARMASEDGPVRFDVAYATTLSADAVPVLIDALSALPSDVQCPLARHLLRRWPPDSERSIRRWNWSAWRASDLVREHEAQLRSMLGSDQKCATP
jgi:Domain of unknown function (DUF4173)